MSKVIGGIREKRKRTDLKPKGGPVLTKEEYEFYKSYFPSDINEAYPDELAAGRTLGLTDEETNLVYSYTGSLAYNLNGRILANDFDSQTGKVAMDVKKKLDAILVKLKSESYNGTVYRGMELGKGKFKSMSAKDAVKYFSETGEFTFTTFVSSSPQWEQSQHFIHDSMTGVVFEIRSKSGRNIKYLSQHEGEDEILFKTNTKFKYVGNYIKQGQYKADWTVIQIDEI